MTTKKANKKLRRYVVLNNEGGFDCDFFTSSNEEAIKEFSAFTYPTPGTYTLASCIATLDVNLPTLEVL